MRKSLWILFESLCFCFLDYFIWFLFLNTNFLDKISIGIGKSQKIKTNTEQCNLNFQLLSSFISFFLFFFVDNYPIFIYDECLNCMDFIRLHIVTKHCQLPYKYVELSIIIIHIRDTYTHTQNIFTENTKLVYFSIILL